jgi:hypothetical protein
MIDRKRVRELSQSAGPSQRKKSKVTARPLADELKQLATEIEALPIGEFVETEPFRARVERLSKLIVISKRRGRPILPAEFEPFVRHLGRILGILKLPRDRSEVRAELEKWMTELLSVKKGTIFSVMLGPAETLSGEPFEIPIALRKEG